MKNSAWYHKLWREKFSNIPIKESSDFAWTGMKNLLDQHMPVNVPVSGSTNISLGTKLFKLIGYILPVVAIISVITYISFPVKKENQIANEKKKPIHLDAINGDDINVEGFNNIQSTRHMDTSGIVYLKDKNISISERRDTRDNSLKKQQYIYNKPQLSKSIKSTKAYNSDQSLTTVPKFIQINTAQNIINSISSNLLDRAIDKSDQNIKPSHSGNSIQTLSTSIVSERNNSTTIEGASIIIPKLSESAVFLSLDTIRKRDLYENEKLKARDKKDTNVRKFKKIKGDMAKLTKNRGIQSGLPNKIAIQSFIYGLEAGTNLGGNGTSFYAGIFGSLSLKKKWLVGIGLNARSNQKISGEFTHPSYFRPDSLPPFVISDTRKLSILDVPLKIGYRLSKIVTFNAGTVISLSLKQSSVSTALKPIADPRDTIYHSQEINSALRSTTLNKINIGFTGGISVHIRRFDINGTYQWFSPFKIRTPLGFYIQDNQFLRLGIGYRFK